MLTFSISGYIKNIIDVPVEGVLVIAENGGGTDTTDADGYEVGVRYLSRYDLLSRRCQ